MDSASASDSETQTAHDSWAESASDSGTESDSCSETDDADGVAEDEDDCSVYAFEDETTDAKCAAPTSMRVAAQQ